MGGRLRVEETGLIYDATKQPRSKAVAAFTSLLQLDSGTVLCSFSVGPKKHDVTSTIGLCCSRDGGRTWRTLPYEFEADFHGAHGSFSAGEMVEIEPGRIAMFTTWFDRSEPERPLFDPETEGILHSKQLLAFSDDEGETWSQWREIPTPGLTGCSGTGPVLRWADGTIAFPFESYKEFDDPSPSHHGAWLLVSRDGCRSFEEPLMVAQHPEHSVFYWDQRLCSDQAADGYIALFWTHDLAAKRDLPVHMRRGNIRRVAGRLGGTDFESVPIRPTTIPGQIAAPLLLDDGRLLAFVVDRDKPGTMKLWQSHDGGASWPAEESLLVYTHDEQAAISQGKEAIDFGQYWDDMTKWSFGHPALRCLEDGSFLAAFYAGLPDCMSIRWARVGV